MKLQTRYDSIITMENLLIAWKEFLRGKRYKKDVIKFQRNLSSNLLSLYEDLINKSYSHGTYFAFNISDPKPRNIHKAVVRDRVLHHLLYNALYPYFDIRFINDSYSCRSNRGTHKALNQFRSFYNKVSRNHTRICYVLKCDVKKFFASIDHQALLKILERHIEDRSILWLLGQVIESFSVAPNKGLPLGNLTSQLLVNVYMHEFDIYIKQELRAKYYIRYADDFVLLSYDREYLYKTLPKINGFLEEKLFLNLHEDKVHIKNYTTGIDFLGWIHFPHHRIIRTSTKRKILKKLSKHPRPETINSYRGLLRHGDTYFIRKKINACNL